MKGTLKSRNPTQIVFKQDGDGFIPVPFKEVVKDDQIKFDLTQKSVYIAIADCYDDNSVEVQKIQR